MADQVGHDGGSGCHDDESSVVLSQCPSPRYVGQWDNWDKVIAEVLRQDDSGAVSILWIC